MSKAIVTDPKKVAELLKQFVGHYTKREKQQIERELEAEADNAEEADYDYGVASKR